MPERFGEDRDKIAGMAAYARAMEDAFKSAWPDPRKDAKQEWKIHCGSCSGRKDGFGNQLQTDWYAKDYKDSASLLRAVYEHINNHHASERLMAIEFEETPLQIRRLSDKEIEDLK